MYVHSYISYKIKKLSKNNYLQLAVESKQHSLTTTFSLRLHLKTFVKKRIELDHR